MAERLAKTLTSPLFSATKTRPSGEKRIAVGDVSPENTMDSENPAGKVAAWTGWVIEPRRHTVAVQTKRNEAKPLLIILLSPKPYDTCVASATHSGPRSNICTTELRQETDGLTA